MAEITCPRCGGRSVRAGFSLSKAGRTQRYKCMAKGHIFQARTLPPPEEKPTPRGSRRRYF
jgi:transposase-like protein